MARRAGRALGEWRGVATAGAGGARREFCDGDQRPGHHRRECPHGGGRVARKPLAGGLTRDLGTLGGATSRAFGLNDAGQIVGMAQDARGMMRPTVWQGDEARDLGAPTDCVGRALGINAGWLVVGSWLCASHLRRAFLWSDGSIVELHLPPGCAGAEAAAINARGQIVGCGWDERGGQRALLWAEGVVTDLNTLLPPGSGWSLEWAGGISDRGMIVGLGRFGGQTRGFLIAPVFSHPAARRDATQVAPTRTPDRLARRPEW